MRCAWIGDRILGPRESGKEDMPNAIKAYVRYVDRFNHVIGRMTMYMIFLMVGRP